MSRVRWSGTTPRRSSHRDPQTTGEIRTIDPVSDWSVPFTHTVVSSDTSSESLEWRVRVCRRREVVPGVVQTSKSSAVGGDTLSSRSSTIVRVGQWDLPGSDLVLLSVNMYYDVLSRTWRTLHTRTLLSTVNSCTSESDGFRRPGRRTVKRFLPFLSDNSSRYTNSGSHLLTVRLLTRVSPGHLIRQVGTP